MTDEKQTPSNFRTEFPDFPADAMPEIPASFVDTSWHNNACPSISSDECELHIWIDYPKPEDREAQAGHRFIVEPQRDGIEITGDWLHTDDWEEVLRFIDNARREVESRKEIARGERILLVYTVIERPNDNVRWRGVEHADSDSADIWSDALSALMNALRDGITAELVVSKSER